MPFATKRIGMKILGFAAGCLLIFSAGPILKAQDQKPRIDEFKRKAQDINREIEKSKAKIQKFSHRETDIILRLNQFPDGKIFEFKSISKTDCRPQP